MISKFVFQVIYYIAVELLNRTNPDLTKKLNCLLDIMLLKV